MRSPAHTPRSRHHILQSLIQMLGLCALLLGALAACGLGAAGATSQPATTHAPGRGLTILPCAGVYTTSAPPVAVLGDKQNVKAADVRVGDIIELQMDIQHAWKLSDVSPSGPVTVENHDGMFDRVNGLCVWRFKASAPGSATITLSGAALCDPTQICPQYIIRQTYTVTVS